MPLVWLALGFTAGLLLSAKASPSLGAIVLLLASVFGAYLVLRSVGLRTGLPLLLAGGMLLGLARGGPHLLDPSGQLHLHHGAEVRVRGLVTDLPELIGGRVRLELEVEELAAPDGPWQAVNGALLVWAQPQLAPLPGRSYPYVTFGDRLMLMGRIAPPQSFADFDYPRYLASQGIGSIMFNALVEEVQTSVGGAWWMRQVQRLRGSLARSLARVLPEPQASLAQALLLGRRGGLPSDVTQAFQASGTAHLLAISGLHVGVVLALTLAASQALLGRRRVLYLLLPLLVVWGYALLAGASPSVVRAGIMGTIYLLALATGRATSPLNALALAALLMLVWDPRSLWHLSFRLSFAAMAGVLLLGVPAWDRLRLVAWGSKERGGRKLTWTWTLGALLVSAGAVVGSLPLVAFNFHQVPLLGIPTTLLALPVLPGLLAGGFAAAVLGLAWPPLGWVAAWLPMVLGGYILLIVESISDISWSVARLPWMEAHLVWSYYAVVVGALAIVHKRRWAPPALAALRRLWTGPAEPVQRAMVLAVLLPFALTPWVAAWTLPDGLAHFYFLDVGQGDAALVRTPYGSNVLIDGGPAEGVTIAAVDRLLPSLDRNIDVAVLSHPDADHLTGLFGLARRGRIGTVLVPPVVDAAQGLWRQGLAGTDAELVESSDGLTVTLPDGVRLEVFHPPAPPLLGTGADTNNNALVVKVSYRDASVLFTGDLEAVGEGVLLDSGADVSVQVLKLAHHGSDTSSIEEFLRAAAPAVVVVSVGADNPFGHPSPEVLDRLRALLPDHTLYATSTHGTIELTTDGERWWVKTHR